MDIKNQQKEINRRDFLQKSAVFATSAILLPFLGDSAYGAIDLMKDNSTVPTVKLNNGLLMPTLGFGTYSLRNEICERSVAEAISVGYRLIDTASRYGNETFVGSGIKKSGIKREELFITSKIWVDDAGYEKAKTAFETSLKKLDTDYLDLYLIHRPRGDFKGSWRMMEELYKEGKIKAIGISNFTPAQYEDLMSVAKIKPAVNQIETHAFFQEKDSYTYMNTHGVRTEAWAPFAEGRNGLFTNQALADIGKKHNKSNAQVSLRWHYQRGVVAIPRTVQKAHMTENLNIFDFKLSESEMKAISALDLNVSQFPEWT
ncbi:aldo/keto reductase [Mucilaginibacter daejeonensis]|uniref:aldo/keto reductase n=1 Tax=Mucilaginibacter daejeonensis TaxID=398049 RepID=UPI001D16FEFB|nr:aldo/keto reductase [Mucilaginibacter daejeonensis]UEG53450.1 aldo/keto reductase [Mucilaginibacter daejeonensis]